MNQRMNSQQNGGRNTQVMRPHVVNINEHVQPNIYYDQMNPRQQYQPQAGGQANNGCAPNHNGSANQHHAWNGKQAPPHNPCPSNTHDIRYMEGNAEPQANEPSSSQSMPMECQNQQLSPNANTITYQLREVYDGTIGEEPMMAVTTRAMRGSAPIEDVLDGHENYLSDDVARPQIQELEKVASTARQATRAVARENEILDEEEGLLFLCLSFHAIK